MKRLKWLLLVIPLMLSLAPIGVPASNPGPILSVESVIDDTLGIGSTFDVNLEVTDVENLFGYQINLTWDPSVLQANNIAFGDFLKGNPDKTAECTPYDDLVEPYWQEEKDPTTTDPIMGGDWFFPQQAFTCEYPPTPIKYTTCSTPGAEQIYGGYGFSAVSEVTIIEVAIMGHCDEDNLTERDGVEIQVSNDGGSTWSPTIHEIPTSRQDLLVWEDVTDDFSWTPAMITSLAVKMRYRQVGAVASTVSINWVGGRVTDTLEIENPVFAHEGVLDTYAEFGYGLRDASFVIGNSSAGIYAGTNVLQVDLNVRYEATASGADDRYRILYYGDSYYWPEPPEKYELVTWTSLASPVATHVWTSGVNLTNPYDPLDTRPWKWEDITPLQVEVETDVDGGDASAIFKLYEVWLTVTFQYKTYSESRIENVPGWAWLMETMWGDYPLGISDSGVLATITFQVLSAYGYTVLEFNMDPDQTELRNPAEVLIPFTPHHGCFNNRLLGDVDGDQDVDAADLLDLSEAYGSETGDANWNPPCNINCDGKVDCLDLFNMSRNYGESV